MTTRYIVANNVPESGSPALVSLIDAIFIQEHFHEELPLQSVCNGIY